LNDSAPGVGVARSAGETAVGILAAISFCHLLNDMMQSLLPALYPMIKSSYRLSFGHIGLLTFTFQFTASLLQPLVGRINEREAWAKSLSDEQIREQVRAWRKEVADVPGPQKSQVLELPLPGTHTGG